MISLRRSIPTSKMAAPWLALFLCGSVLFANPAEEAANVVQIVAHRGASAERPENTLIAFQRAVEVGATVVEMDVRTTQDDQLVIMHDPTIDRTTDGSGTVNSLTLAQLQKFDAGSHFDPAYQQVRIPTLREALQFCRDKVDVLLDLKETGKAYTKAVATEVSQFGDPKRTIVGVHSVEQAIFFHQQLPESRLFGFIPGPDAIEPFAKAAVQTIRLWPQWIEKDHSLPERVHQSGAKLHINILRGTLDEVLSILPYGPDSILSDDPRQVLESLDRIRNKHKE